MTENYRLVEVPNMGKVEFPASMSDDEVANVIKTKIMPTQTVSKPQESASMQQGRSLSPTARGVIGTMQGPTFGFLDELAGLAKMYGETAALKGDAPFVKQQTSVTPPIDPIEAYSQGRDVVRGATKQFEEDYPIKSAVAQGVSSLPTMLIPGLGMVNATSKAGKIATLLDQLKSAAVVGAKTGAVGSAGGSEAANVADLAGDVAKGATISSAISPTLTAAGRTIGAVGSRIAQQFLPESVQNAVRQKLAEYLQRGVKSDTVFDQPNALSTPAGKAIARLSTLGPEATIADVGGESTRRLLDVLATVPGKAKSMVETEIKSRQGERSNRIMTAADKALDTGNLGYSYTINGLETAQKAAAAPFYDALKDVSVRVDDNLFKLLQRAPEAHKAAEKLARTEGKVPIDLSKLKVGDDVPFDAIDTMKKTLWQLAESEKPNFKATAQSNAYNDLRTSLTNKMDELSPKDKSGNSIYKLARDSFSGPAELITAVEKGRKALGTDIIDLTDLVKGMSASELEAFKVGALQSLRDKTGTQSGQTQLLNQWKESKTSDKLRQIFNNDYRQFAASLAKEAELKKLETVGRGSQTAARGFAADDLSSTANAVDTAVKATTGGVSGAIKGVSNIWNRVQMPEQTRNKLAELLLTKGSKAELELNDLQTFIRLMNANKAKQAAAAAALSQSAAGSQFSK